MKKDIVIIGSGPGGYKAAEMAGKSGFNTALIEMDKLGGVCLNKGCLPTKTLYKEAEVIGNMVDAVDHGVSLDGFQINIDVMRSRQNLIIEKSRNEIKSLMKLSKVEVVKGIGTIKDKNHVIVKMENGSTIEIETEYIIISTGSAAEKLSIPGKDLEGVITCEEVLKLDRKIDEIVIIGGGFIGVEMAGILSSLGTKVKIVECGNEILSNIDHDIRNKLYDYAAKKGILIYKSCCAKKIVKEKHRLGVEVSSGDGVFTLYGDTVMMSTGRAPVTDNLNLDEVGVKYNKNGILVDQFFRTNIYNIFAIGDVIGGLMLAHVAFNQGIKVVENIKGNKETLNDETVPYCIYSFPEIAGVGFTENKVKEKGIKYKIGYSSFANSRKAMTMADTDGFVKVICNDDGVIIGVHILGPHASDVIHEGALAVYKKLKTKDIINCIHAHPTLSESFHEAVCNVERTNNFQRIKKNLNVPI